MSPFLLIVCFTYPFLPLQSSAAKSVPLWFEAVFGSFEQFREPHLARSGTLARPISQFCQTVTVNFVISVKRHWCPNLLVASSPCQSLVKEISYTLTTHTHHGCRKKHAIG